MPKQKGNEAMTYTREDLERLVWDYGRAVHFYRKQGDTVAHKMDAVTQAISSLFARAEELKRSRAVQEAVAMTALEQRDSLQARLAESERVSKVYYDHARTAYSADYLSIRADAARRKDQ